ncbi:MAG TPA: HAMP domain-containing sensor histidine kinase [Solirubrobacteraceae bacterium]|nr:HAMP domain-containing sensor histidine kinase [Solirubrobacteraceae bacterium]
MPTLESSLRNQRLDSLAAAADRYSTPIWRLIGTSADVRRLDRAVKAAADDSGDRVTLLGVTRGTYGVQTFVTSDSTDEVEIRDLDFAIAAEAARTGRIQRGTEAGDGGPVGEAAKPLLFRRRDGRRVAGSVVVFSAPLSDVQQTVQLITRRILIAGAAGLLAALLAAWLAARRVSRRIGRMERVARRVAAGDFSQRFEGGGSDELARLAQALDHMQRQLAELDRARRGFIATASHELRTPIFSLGGFLELLEDEELDEDERRRFTQQLREQVDRLGRLATGLLDLSRLESGSLELRPEPTDLGRLAQEIAAEFTPALAAHESHVELRTGRDELEIECDPDRVAQILRILLDNALSHTPAGTDVVVAAARRDGRARVAVTDFGTGIKRADMPRIFEPFFSADAARGSGLGLAIAHELAERMAGDLSVESRPGRTTFTLELPA